MKLEQLPEQTITHTLSEIKLTARQTTIKNEGIIKCSIKSILTAYCLILICFALSQQQAFSQKHTNEPEPKYQEGKDLRRKPYTLFRIRIDAKPVLLR
jgi:hypothetical protein